MGPLGASEIVYRALNAPRPQRLLVWPAEGSELYLVRIVDRSILALTEKAEEDLALEMLRDGVISVDGLMRARRRAARDHNTLVEGLLTEKVVSPQMMREHARAATKEVMEELFALKAARFMMMPEERGEGHQVFLHVQPDNFVVDFVRRSVTPLRARKVLGEIGDRFRLTADASSRLSLCGLLASERDVLEKFDGGDTLQAHLAHEDSSYSQVAAQAIFAGLAIAVLVPDDGPVDLWEDIEVGPTETRNTPEPEPSPQPEAAPSGGPASGGFSVPAVSTFAAPASSEPTPAPPTKEEPEPIPLEQESATSNGRDAPSPDAMPDRDFDELVAALEEDSFDSHRLSLLRKIAPNRKFTVDQLVQILRTMDFDSPGRAEAAAAVYPRLTDPENIEAIYGTLTHEPNRKVLEARLGELATGEPPAEKAEPAPEEAVPARAGNGRDAAVPVAGSVEASESGALPDEPHPAEEDEDTPASQGVVEAIGPDTTSENPPRDDIQLLEEVVKPGPGFMVQARVPEERRPIVRPSDPRPEPEPEHDPVALHPVAPGPNGSAHQAESHEPAAPPTVSVVPPPAPGGGFRLGNIGWMVLGMVVVLAAVAVGYMIGEGNQPVVQLTPTPATPSPTPTVTVATATPEPSRTIVVATPKPTPKPLTPEQRASKQAWQHWSKGRTYHKAGRVRAAVDEFQRAIELQPNNARFHAHLALALYDMDDLSGAERSARKAVSLNRREPWGHLALANVHQAAGRTDEAIASYERFLALEPKGQMAREVRQIVEMLRMQ